MYGRPIKKCAGERQPNSVFGTTSSGLELTTASTCVYNVYICSNVSSVFLTTRLSCNFTERTSDSHIPPQWRAIGGINLHCIPSSAKDAQTISLWFRDMNNLYISFSCQEEPIKVLPLSLQIRRNFPLLAINLLKVTNLLQVLNGQQMQRGFNRLWFLPANCFNRRGPAQSQPEFSNGKSLSYTKEGLQLAARFQSGVAKTFEAFKRQLPNEISSANNPICLSSNNK